MKVLFVCSHNIARSQMGQALLTQLYGDRFEAASAGTHPGSGLNPYVVKAMAEIGIDISQEQPKGVDDFAGQSFDYVITVCDAAGQECPSFPGGGVRIHKSFADPSRFVGGDEEQMAQARALRDAMKAWIEEAFSGYPGCDV